MTSLSEADDISTEPSRISATSRGRNATRYLRLLRDRIWLLLVVLLITTGAAVVYVVTAQKVYEASADILVTAIPPDDQTFIGLGLITTSSDPSRDVQTAARLVESDDVAARARHLIDSPRDPRAILARVSAVPVAKSSILSITAKGDTASEASNLANAVASATVTVRNVGFNARLATVIKRLQSEVDQSTGTQLAQSNLQTRLAQLRSLQGADDPTMQVVTRASLPASPASPKPALSVAAGILTGLVLGMGAVLGLAALQPDGRPNSTVTSAQG